jgi:hypothetical protein
MMFKITLCVAFFSLPVILGWEIVSGFSEDHQWSFELTFLIWFGLCWLISSALPQPVEFEQL